MAILDLQGKPYSTETIAMESTGRGASVLNLYEIMKVRGLMKDGRKKSVPIQMAWASIDPFTALWLVSHCDLLFGPITRRANRISNLPWQVLKQSKHEDRLAEEMKMKREEFFESKALTRRAGIWKQLRRNLKDLWPNLENFDSALRRWNKRIRLDRRSSEEEIQNWFRKPAGGVTATHLIKQMVFDLMTHGRACAEPVVLKGRESLLALPGGTVVPVRGDRVGPIEAYLQIWNQNLRPMATSRDTPILFTPDEIVFGYYMPNSATAPGLTPLQALINTVASSLLTDEMVKEYSDGNRDPEKLIIFGSEARGPADPANMDAHKAGISQAKAQQLHIELNQRKNTPVTVIRDSGTPTVIDVSRENILALMMSNLPVLKQKVALCLNMSALEMGEGGSEQVSGRNTAEQQSDVDESAGWGHMAEEMEGFISDAIDKLWGPGFSFDFSRKQTQAQRIQQAKEMSSATAFSINEIREDAGKDPYPDPEFDRPLGGQSPGDTLDAGLQGLAALSKGGPA